MLRSVQGVLDRSAHEPTATGHVWRFPFTKEDQS
jgi:hypothetical protein